MLYFRAYYKAANNETHKNKNTKNKHERGEKYEKDDK